MRVGRAHWATAIAVLLIAWGFAGTQPDAARAAENPIGVHSMLQLSFPRSFMESMFAEAAAVHASAIRLDVAPAIVFGDTSKPPDFSGLDAVVALAQQYHLRVVADLFTIPWWIANCQGSTEIAAMDRCGTDDLVDYRSMIEQIVARADPVIRDWEIWNEPDLGAFFTGTPSQYAQMLRAAHDAVKQIDPQANVLLGGISGLAGTSWLSQVFAIPGPDAAHAFDIANVHERGALDGLAGDLAAWKKFLGGSGFSGRLWVTEHGYPADPAFQSDASYTGGPASQAAYLRASIPTLVDAGAAEVFLTERDNLGGQFASEGLLGGNVLDPGVADPQVVEKPSYAAVRALSDCYTSLGRDCPGSPPAATPVTVTMATAIGSPTTSTVAIGDPGSGPLQLGAVALGGASGASISIASDGCSNRMLEPNQTCAVAVRFAPVAGGAAAATLELPSENGTLSVGVNAVAPAVSSLVSRQLADPQFQPVGSTSRPERTQRLVLQLTNPLIAPVRIAGAALIGESPRFSIESDQCAGADLAPGTGCRLSVLFRPAAPGDAYTVLEIRGDGTPLFVALHASALPRPAVRLLASTATSRCFSRSTNRVLVVTDQRAAVRWRLVLRPQPPDPRCAVASAGGRFTAYSRSAESGLVATGARPAVARGRRGYVARFRLQAGLGRRGLRPGAYELTVIATNAHGSSRPARTWLTVVEPAARG